MSSKKSTVASMSHGATIARMAGTLSGLIDRLGIIQQECMNAASRCNYILTEDATLKETLTEEEATSLKELKKYVESRFDEMTNFHNDLNKIMTRSHNWK